MISSFAAPGLRHGLEETTRLSKEGVHHLAINDSQTASSFFRAALICINQSLEVINKHGGTRTGDCLSGEYYNKNHDSPNGVNSFPSPVLLPVPISCMEDDVFYIHNQAIYVDFTCLSSFGPDSAQDCTNTTNNTTISLYWASIVTLFNLALAYHHHGINNGSKDSLRRACELYARCDEAARDAAGAVRRAGAGRNNSSVSAAAGTSDSSIIEEEECIRKMMQIAVVSRNNHAQIRYRYMVDREQSKSIDLLYPLDDRRVLALLTPTPPSASTSPARANESSSPLSPSSFLLPFLSQSQADEILINRCTLLASASVVGMGDGHRRVARSASTPFLFPCAGAA